VEGLVWVELMFLPIWSRSSLNWTSGLEISAGLSHGEELEMATSRYIGKRSTMPLTTAFLNQSQEYQLPRPRQTNTVMTLSRFLVTFKMVYEDKAADQPSGTVPLANELRNIFARLLAPF
jgi:hypothetical protein